MQDISEALSSPTSRIGAIVAFVVFGSLTFGGEWLFGGPTAHEARRAKERYREACVGKGLEAHLSEYCRTHDYDGNKLDAHEIAKREAWEKKLDAHFASKGNATSAPERDNFEALLQDASR